MRTVAVVLAGGVGARIGHPVPKQLLEVAGRPIMEHSVATLDARPEIDEVAVLMTPGWVEHVRAMLGRRYAKLSWVEAGGETRNESTRIALRLLGERCEPDCRVLFHDAVRPLVDSRIIRDCVRALDHHRAVSAVIPSSDTIVAVDAGVVTDIPDRARLRRVQTPQGFHLGTIRRAYELAWQDPGFTSTDDCSVVVRYLPDVPVAVVDGSEQNIKITHPIDVFLADELLRRSAEQAATGVRDGG